MTCIRFDLSPEELDVVVAIAKRANSINPRVSILDLQMDIAATHLNGCLLDLPRLMKSKNSDFIHDLAGIRENLDRTTGKLVNHFLPRFTMKGGI